MIVSIFRSKPKCSTTSVSNSLHAPYCAHNGATLRTLASKQRRYSSSKPSSSSNNNSKTIPTSPSPAVKEVSVESRKRSASKASRLKSKDGSTRIKSSTIGSNLPSVPSTKHLHAQDVTLASFFSLHRPISVSSPVPPASTTEAFSSLFSSSMNDAKGKAYFTLSSAVESPSVRAVEQHQTNATQPAAMQTSSGSREHPLGPRRPIFINVEELANTFRPFNPPLPPEPAQSMHGDSAYRDITHVGVPLQSSTLASRGFILPFSRRMQARRIKWDAILGRLRSEIWQTISVKRQRKLKMKKHKYKKLMKRTRNLRRRQDRL